MNRTFKIHGRGTCRLVSALIVGLAGQACTGVRGPTPATTQPAEPVTAEMSKLPLRTVSSVDLPRFMGDWRVIANIPYFAERDAVDSVESYALRPDGTIANWFVFRRGSWEAPLQRYDFSAEVVNTQTNAEWRVRFLPFVKVAYLVLDLDPDYQWTVIGHPSRRYGWIMARERSLPDSVYAGIVRRLADQGYDPSRFVKVPQIPPGTAPTAMAAEAGGVRG
jgi:apolipoprotein D and lipocalin family protein